MLLLLAIKANRLCDCENVRLVEYVIERGAAVPGSSKHDPLRRHSMDPVAPYNMLLPAEGR